MEDLSAEEHLTELRTRILFCLLFFVPTLLVGFWLCPHFLRSLEGLAPKGTIFFQLKPGELLFVYVRLTCILAVVLALPFCLFQVAAFLWPALKKKEKYILVTLFGGGSVLFALGLSFAYGVALRPLLGFLLGFGVDLSLVQPQYSLDYFVALVLGLLLVFGIMFQIPILLFVLALLDLISSAQLWTYWKQALFASFVIAAIATPTPDPINMLILGCAIAGLYAISLVLIKLCGK